MPPVFYSVQQCIDSYNTSKDNEANLLIGLVLLAQESVRGEARSDMQSHNARINNECNRDTHAGELVIGAVQQHGTADGAHAEFGYQERQITGVEERGHQVIALGGEAAADPADRDDGVDEV